MPEQRIALILGAGGTAGHAFHAGVLETLSTRFGSSGFDPANAELIVGTSAGSLIAALLRAGVTPAELAAEMAGERPATAASSAKGHSKDQPKKDQPKKRCDAEVLRHWQDQRNTEIKRVAGTPRNGRSSPTPVRLVAGALTTPWRVRFGSALAGLAPAGLARGDLAVPEVDALFPHGWPAAPMWLVAVQASTGTRVVFGRHGEPAAVGPAVAASSCVPGVYLPQVIGGQRYLDGGVHSTTNADLAARGGVTHALVLAPMAAHPRAVRDPIRAYATTALAVEVAALRLRGVHVTTIVADAAVIAATGKDALDPNCRVPVVTAARQLAQRFADTRATIWG